MPYRDPEVRRAYNRAYRLAHLEKKRAADKAYRLAHLEEHRAYDKAYRLAHLEERRAKDKAYAQTHREEAKVRARAWGRTHFEQRKIWRANNRERIRAARRLRDKIRSRERRIARKSRRRSDLNWKIAEMLRIRLHTALKRNFKAGSAVRDLGCSLPELVKHIEQQFEEGMTWENWGRGEGKWVFDHIVPLRRFDLTDREQFLIAAHYTNLQPLWDAENSSKGDRLRAKDVKAHTLNVFDYQYTSILREKPSINSHVALTSVH